MEKQSNQDPLASTPINPEEQAQKSDKKRKFYLVIKGSKPGVYTSKRECLRQNKPPYAKPYWIKCGSLEEVQEKIDRNFEQKKEAHCIRVRQEVSIFANYVGDLSKSKRHLELEIEKLRQKYKEPLTQVEKINVDPCPISILVIPRKINNENTTDEEEKGDTIVPKTELQQFYDRVRTRAEVYECANGVYYRNHGELGHVYTVDGPKELCPTWIVSRGRSLGMLNFSQYEKAIIDYPDTVYKRFNTKEDAHLFLINDECNTKGYYQYYIVVNVIGIDTYRMFKDYKDAIRFYIKSDQNMMYGFNDIHRLFLFIQNGFSGDGMFEDYQECV
jgi:hypothetical protein